MTEDLPTWTILLISLGYQVLEIYAPERFRKFLQGGTLGGAEWLPTNQARRISNLQYSCFLCQTVQVLSDSYGEEVSIWIGRQC